MQELNFDVIIDLSEKYQPRFQGVVKFIEDFVTILPSYKDSRGGRKGAHQVRAVLSIGAILFAVLSDNEWIWLAGLIVLLSVLVLPLRELKKRTILTKLKRYRSDRRRLISVPGKVILNDRRLELHQNESMIRRVLVGNHDFHILDSLSGEMRCLTVSPPTQKKRESILLCDSHPTHAQKKSTLATLSDNDIAVRLSTGDWETLKDALVARQHDSN